MAHALVGVVVQIYVRDFDFARRQGIRVNAESVILRGDFHFFGEHIFHRMVRAVMTEFQFEGLAAECETAKLMPKANAEDGNTPDQTANVFDGVADRFGIAGAVREENTVGIEREDVFGAGLCGHNPSFTMMVHKKAKNILLDAEIVRDDAEFASVRSAAGIGSGFGPRRECQLNRTLFPAVGFLAGDPAGEFLAGHRRELLGLKDKLIGRCAVGCNDSTQRAEVSDMANKSARINIPDDGNLMAVQIELRGFRGTPVRGDLRKFANDQRFDEGMRGFLVIEIGADIPDVGISKADDLARVTGIGENFLIAGETGIENDFATTARDSAGGAAVKDAPVFECKNSGAVRDLVQLDLPVRS